MKISAVVIAKNEAAMIGRCLASLAWADEVIVIDSGSTDSTVDICRSHGAIVHVADWHGPGPQRNRGIDAARGEWIIALDADEWVTAELRQEIDETLRNAGSVAVYKIPRLSSYCGRYMRHGGWWPDYVTRLFKRGHARYAGGIVHDHLDYEGPVGRLRNPLRHEPFTDLTEVLEKINSYSTWGAQLMFDEGRRAGLVTALAHALWTFFRTYVLHMGFLDGREGFLLAISNAEGTYYKYAKLMLLGAKKSHPKRNA